MVTARELVDSLDRRHNHNWAKDVEYLTKNHMVTQHNVRIFENKYLDAWNAYTDEYNKILAMNRRQPQPDHEMVLEILDDRLENMKWIRDTIHNLWRAVGAQDARCRR